MLSLVRVRATAVSHSCFTFIHTFIALGVFTRVLNQADGTIGLTGDNSNVLKPGTVA